MPDLTLSAEDREAVLGVLLSARDGGVARPLLAADVGDVDGLVDAFGLDDDDQVVVVPGVPLAQTLFEASGDEEPVDHEGLETDMGGFDG